MNKATIEICSVTETKTVEAYNPLAPKLIEVTRDGDAVIVDGVLWSGCQMVSYDITYPKTDVFGYYPDYGGATIKVHIRGLCGEAELHPKELKFVYAKVVK